MVQMEGHKSFNSLIGHNDIRYYSYGRHALAAGLRMSGIGNGDRVLLSAFICRDLLSAINTLGAEPVYYPVDKGLSPISDLDNLPAAKAIIAVNYFGFPQDLNPFRDYCARTGAMLVEDNAHGLFSRDEDGCLLGTRGDVGIFSLHKTIFMPDGAALVINSQKHIYKLDQQIEFDDRFPPAFFLLKSSLKKISSYIGSGPLRAITNVVRRVRKSKSGYEILPSAEDAEYRLPDNPRPCKNLLSYMASVDVDKESKRRRDLYIFTENLLINTGAIPIFENIHEKIVPYGYSFYADNVQIKNIKNILKKQGLECFRWPELPDSIKNSAPEHYKTIWIVNFL